MVSEPRVRSAFIVASAVIGVAACSLPEKTIAPEQHLIVVHAILDLSTKNQFVMLSHTDDRNSNYVSTVDTGLLSSVVTVTTPEGIVMTARRDSVYDSYGKRYYPAAALRITPSDFGVTLTPGATYSLRVQTTAGEVVTGTTTVPLATPVAMSQGDLFHRDIDTLRLTWHGVAGAAAYFIGFDQIIKTGTDTFFYSRYSRLAFGPIDFAGHAKADADGADIFGSYCSPCAIEMAVLVAAVDSNYYQYYRKPGDPFAPALPSRLTGAIGVFGSMVPIWYKHFTVR